MIYFSNYNSVLRLSVFLLMLLIGCAGSIETQQPDSSDQLYSWLNLDTIKAGKFDNGKMWTFEYPPLDYFREEYNFVPTKEWLDHVRLSALRFATYCSASFVSADGLVMTNDHCARESVVQVQQEGESLNETGFYAETLEDERQVPGLFVDQLVLIKDVTEEIQFAMDKAATEEERALAKKNIIAEIEKRENENSGLRCNVTSLYNGGRYSLYGYKRYNDVRLVFSPEASLGFFGGDPDNFTFPRYNLDCSFFRVYDEDGNPLKTDNYLTWSQYGAEENEPVFVVGNPGTTNRLNSTAQLQFFRDYQYPRVLDLLGGLMNAYNVMIEEKPEEKDELEVQLLSFSNSYKAYTGILNGLRDPVLMQRKIDFEKNFKNAVQSNSSLNSKYGDVWDKLSDVYKEMSVFTHELYLTTFHPIRTSQHFFIAGDLIELANELKLPEDQRSDLYKGEELQYTIESIFPEDFDVSYNNKILEMQINMLNNYLGTSHSTTRILTGGNTGKSALDYVLNKSSLISKEKVLALIDKGGDAILNSDDPFIRFVLETEARKNELLVKSQQLSGQTQSYNEALGRAIFDVYGTSIPPDATFTLRLADGVVKGFPYNGTVAPVITTFYGMYDRYYSFNKKFPWNLPERWVNPPAEFKLETPYNFVSTNDIIGGNSGSPVVNIKGEVVGLAFDGNIQSLPGNFIFRTEENRTVSVHSAGMLEVIKNLYKATRLSNEIMSGKLTEANNELIKELVN